MFDVLTFGASAFAASFVITPLTNPDSLGNVEFNRIEVIRFKDRSAYFQRIFTFHSRPDTVRS